MTHSEHAYPTDSTEWLKRLISHDTTSHLSNLQLIDEIAQFVKQLGLSVTLTYNETRSKANLFATLANANDPSAGKIGGIILSGHSDVVPVTGQAWTHDPFAAWISDGKLYGRGACDMKGFIACCLAFLPKAVQLAARNQLKHSLHLAISYDEEVGCLGAPVLLDDLARRGVRPDYCIVGEPTNMQMISAHKGIHVYTCRVHGKSAHSSLTHQGVNAISYAAQMVGFIDELAQTLKARTDTDTLFDVPYATLSVGMITGGTATNIVPNLCEFSFDYRNLPHMQPSDVLDSIYAHADSLSQVMQRALDASGAADGAQVGIEIIQNEAVPAMSDKDSGELQKLIMALTDAPHRPAKKVAYATEGGQFTQAGIPTIICGPGSIEQAHRADEYVTLAQLACCDAFLAALFTRDA